MRTMLGIFLDTETNGLNPKVHRILEIAYKVLHLETGEVLETFDALVFQPQDVWENSDPRSLEVNGFRREIVDQGRQEQDVAADIKRSFEKHALLRGNAAFICQNPSFDRIFFSQLISAEEQEELGWPYHWLDLASMYWGKLLTEGETYPWVTGFSKDKIAQAYNLPSEEAPHRASRGVDHLLACYSAVLGFPAQSRRENGPISRN